MTFLKSAGSHLRFIALALMIAEALSAPAAAQVTTTASVVVWGCDAPLTNFGQCSVPSDLAAVSAVAAGEWHSLALKRDGTVVAWGCAGGANFGQCTIPGG